MSDVMCKLGMFSSRRYLTNCTKLVHPYVPTKMPSHWNPLMCISESCVRGLMDGKVTGKCYNPKRVILETLLRGEDANLIGRQ